MFFKKKDFTHFIYLSLFLFFLFSCFFYMKYYSTESFQNSSPSLLPIYFINLKESKIRYNKMMNQCKDKHCIRIHAIHGKKDKLHTEMVKNKSLKNTSIACFQSHIKALETFIKSPYSYGIIVEDDVVFNEHFENKIKEILNEIREESFDIIYFGGTRVCGEKYSKHLIKPKQIRPDCNAGAFAYMVNKNSANRILERYQIDGIYKMYDHQLRDYFGDMNIFYTNPPLVKHDYDLPSDRLHKKYKQNYVHSANLIHMI